MRWAHDHPEEYAEIARLPLNQQTAALREAIGYDPDAVRDRLKEGHTLGDRPTTSPRERSALPPGAAGVSSRGEGFCSACGAPAGVPCASWCRAEQVS